MSIKKLFDARQTRKTGKILAPSQNNSLAGETESIEQVKVALDDKNEFVPPLDYSEPANFVKFGSAYRYYVDALEYVADEYPYDGTSKDKLEFENNLNPLEKYILDTEHPSSTGYAIMGATYGSRGSQSSTTGYYSASAEFIHIKGGPNASSKLKADGTPDFKDETANVFYTGSAYGRRSNNLEFGGASGSTIEFFFKKSTFSTATSTREVVYDAWTGLAKNQAGYGRFTVEVKSGSLGGDPDVVNSFFVTYQSGTAGVFRAAVPVTSSGASLADGNWHHYAFVLGVSGSKTSIDVYKDGECFGNQITTGSNIGLVTGAIEARVGALITAPSGTSVPAGYGKLSASLDEFRVWKDKRTPEEVGRNWFTNIYGGTNTTTDKLGQSLGDTDLGLYFKFNEGITGTDSTDSVVLDYSGRISNGTWTGFTSGSSRNTGSALVSSSASEFETADPIVRKNNPLYISKKTELTNLGNSHDYQNNSSLYYSMPDWIINEDSETNEELYKLTQIMASYLDTLYAQTTHLFKVGDVSYTSGSDKPFPYNDRLLQSMGFETPELFTNANLISQFLQKDDKRQLELKLHNIKNEIYKNIYNNLSFIYKSKGTAKSFRNLVRCYGVGDDLFKINTYVNNETYKLDQDASSSLGWYLPSTSAKRYVDMTGLSNEGDISGSVFSFPDTSNSNSYGFLSGNANLDSYAFTLEAEIFFPRKPEPGDQSYPSFPNVSASLFGFHTPDVTDPEDTELRWATGANTDYGLQVYAVHTTGTYSEVTEPIQASRDAYFVVKNSAGTTLLTSTTFTNVYDNKSFKFALSLRPTKYPYAEDTTGTTLAGSEKYTLELYAVNSIVGEKQASLSGTVAAIAAGNPGLTASLSYTDGSNILESGKRVYVGAHRTNFTGSVIALSGATDIRASGIRWWNTYLPSGTIDLHSYDIDSFGLVHPYRNIYNFESNDPAVYIPEIQTLAFNWDFITVTGSNGSGEFIVTDFSSGSAGSDYEGSYQGAVFTEQNLKHITGKGVGFTANSTPVKKEYVYTGKQRLPEQIYPEDMVEVKNSDEETFTRDSRPYRFFFAVEKSMYDAISREMLEMFASIQDFNNLIGDPVNKYRMRYKDMEKLREIFFRRIGNTPDLDKYLDYFKWLDSSMGVMIEQLFPASAKVAENVRVMVENHVLERNKIKFQYPTLEDREPDIQAGLRGSGCSQLYSWRFNHAPIGLSQDTNCGWWFNRAERDGPTLSTGIPTALQTARQTLLENTHFLPTPAEYEDTQRNTGENIPTAATKFACFEAAYLGGVIGGVNQEINKVRNVSPFTFDQFRAAKDCDDEFVPNEKVKINFRSVKDGVGFPGDLMSPFSIYSSSVNSGYRATLVAGGLAFQDLSNIHEDSYHPTQYEVPMQGPFTKQHVGGLIYRNNKALLEQNSKLRTEGFTLSIASSTGTVGDIRLSTSIPKGQYYRGLVAKSPVNISNILTTTASAGAQASSSYTETATTVRVLGNFSKNYEVVHTQGRDINNLDLRHNTSAYNVPGAASPYLGGLVDYEIPQRKATFKSNKTVFVERFSAPGGVATSTPAFLDVTSQQYSTNNALPFRNIGVRAPLQELLKTRQAWGGFVKGIYPEAIDLGHTTLEELNTGSFSVPVVSYHKTQRNILNRIKQTLAPTIETGSIADNEYVTRPIPQADRYHWFQSINKNDTNYKPYDNVSPARTTYGFYVDNESTYPRTFGRHGVYLPTTSSLSAGELTAFQGVGDYRLNATTNQTGRMVTALNGELVFRWSGGSVFPIWKALRTGETPLGREPRESNTYTRYETVSGEPNSLFSSSARSVSNFSASYRSAPVTSKHKPMYHLVNAYVGTAEKDSPDAFTDVSFRYTYGNEYQGFAHTGLDDHLDFSPEYGRRPYDVFRKVSLEYASGNRHAYRVAGIKAFKQFVYDEVIYPKDIYTYLSGTRERLGFSNNFWRANGAGTASATAIAAITTNSSILANTSSYNPEMPRITAGYTNSQGYVHLNKEQQSHDASTSTPSGNGSGSIWPMDSFLYARYMNQLKSNSTMAYAQNLPGGELMTTLYGALNWNGSSAPDYTGSINTRAAQYVYNVPAISASKPESRSPGGPTTRPAWTAGDSRKIVAGPNKGNSATARYPFYDTYDDWANEVRLAGQDYTIVPEYRASEHIFKLLDTNNGRIGLFNDALLSITGSTDLSSSSQVGSYERPAQPDGPLSAFEQADPSFIERYSTTELFTYLESVMERDFEANGPPTDLRLTAKTVQKLLPYDGFYPMNRATQLATLFSQSISPAVTFTGTFTGKRQWQTVLKPYFAPGIFFNSIKSGIAVDHPVRSKNSVWSAGSNSWDDQYGVTDNAVTSDSDPLAGCLSGTITGSTKLPTHADLDSDTPNDSSNMYWFRRADFTHILDPVKYAHESSSLYLNDDLSVHLQVDSTGSFSKSDVDRSRYDEYKSGTGNFFGGVPEFFLKNGQMSKLVSKIPDPENIQVEKGKTYVMEVVLRKTSNFNMYSNPYAFGIPTSTGSVDWDSLPDDRKPAGSNWPLHRGEFAPFTPPYFYGDSIARIVYKPQDSLLGSGGSSGGLQIGVYSVSLNEILADIKSSTVTGSFITYHNSNDYLFDQDQTGTPTLSPDHGWNRAWLNKMNLSASVVLDNNYEKLTGEATNLNQWVIMPKWECPILDFPREDTSTASKLYNFSSSVDVGSYNSGSNAPDKTYGMWHQYGVTPDPGEGVKMLVRGLPAEKRLRKISSLVASSDAASAEVTTLSFADNGQSSFSKANWEYDPADSSTQQRYFEITVKGSSSNTTYVVSFVDGSSVTGKTISGKTTVSIDIASVSNAAQLITTIKNALTALTDITATETVPTAGSSAQSVDGGKVTITQDNAGAITDAVVTEAGWIVNSVTGVSISIVQGADAGTALTQTNSTILSDVEEDSLGDLAELLGFVSVEEEREEPRYDTAEQKVQQTIRRRYSQKEVSLGEVADSKTVHEAIAAIPYYLTGEEPNQQPNFIRIPPNAGAEFGTEIKQLIRKMERYNLPPGLQMNLDQLKINGTQSLDRNIGPLACYLFEFNLELDKQDLADIWQGIMPEQSIRMLGKRGEVTVYGIDHALVYGETGEAFLEPRRLDNRLKDLLDVQPEFSDDENSNCFKPEIQWLVFKVKQKGMGSYQEMIKKEITPYLTGIYNNGSDQDTTSIEPPPKSANVLERGYNWPYDYFSFVEMAKIEGQVRFRPHVSELEGVTFEYTPPDLPPTNLTTPEVVDRPEPTGGDPVYNDPTSTDESNISNVYAGLTSLEKGHNHQYAFDENKTGITGFMTGPLARQTPYHTHKIVDGVVQAEDQNGNPLDHDHLIRLRN
jgi:hypothetical protein